jgi:hypothetical protein
MCSYFVALPDAFGSEPLKARISSGLVATSAQPSIATFGHSFVMGIGKLRCPIEHIKRCRR